MATGATGRPADRTPHNRTFSRWRNGLGDAGGARTLCLHPRQRRPCSTGGMGCRPYCALSRERKDKIGWGSWADSQALTSAFILDNGISWRHKPSEDRPRDTDTAQQAYWDVLALGFEVVRLFKGPKVYQGISWYDQIWINDKPTIGHMWYGTRFQESNSARTKAELDGIKLADHLARKAAFMAEPAVAEILAENGANV
jgi:hypothetical protein